MDINKLEFFRHRYYALIEIDHKIIGDTNNASFLSLDDVVTRLNEQDEELRKLKKKMNKQAFELYKYHVVSFGKAVELSTMNYHEFLKYADENGCPMELQL